MSLTLEWSPSERAVRSIGDPPNGILSVGRSPERWTFYIDAKVDPTGGPGVRASTDAERMEGTMLTVAEVYEAIGDDFDLAAHVFQLSTAAFRAVIDLAFATDSLPMIGAMLEWLIEVRNALAEVIERKREAGEL